jgi:hypothetical protein
MFMLMGSCMHTLAVHVQLLSVETRCMHTLAVRVAASPVVWHTVEFDDLSIQRH